MYVHYIVVEMMMSVLQEIKGLTKELYITILSRRKSSVLPVYFVPCVIICTIFCMQLLFDMFSTLMSLEVRLN